MSVAPWELVAAVALDLAFGDPRRMPHPIRAAGWLIALLHLAIFDKLYLYRGSLKKLGLQKAGRKLRGE